MSVVSPPLSTPVDASEEPESFRCARHAKVETVLRCGRCEVPICPRCMVLTPVGARCPTCAQVRRFAMVTKPAELAAAGAAGVGVAVAGGLLLQQLPGFWLFGLAFLGFGVGHVVSSAAKGKRATELAIVAVVTFLLGVIGVLMVSVGPAFLIAPLRVLAAVLSSGGLAIGLAAGALLAWMRAR